MATLTFTYDTGTVTLARIVTGLCAAGNYQATIPDPANPGQTISNPETQAAFAKRYVGQFITSSVLQSDTKTAVAALTAVTLS